MVGFRIMHKAGPQVNIDFRHCSGSSPAAEPTPGLQNDVIDTLSLERQ